MKRIFLSAAILMASLAGAQAQSFTQWGTSDPSPVLNCEEYQWPGVQSPCPEVQIREKHNHTPMQQYRERGYDTVLSCGQHEIILSCMPYIPVQYFNGQYTVDAIPFDPPDSSFHYGANLPNGSDDAFCGVQNLPADFPFYFFGKQKNAFVAGGNGIISFTLASATQHCDYGNYSGLPWSAASGGGNNGNQYPNVAYHRDAIYGVFEDTDPSCINSSAPNYYGIWYGIKDIFPCRKIIASYNQIPWFSCSSNLNNRQSYQIVCYEGSNIIEVHIRHRSPATCGWCQNGILGIQNENGLPQVNNGPMSDTRFVVAGAHPAYFPAGLNPITNQTMDSVAYRFTPQGRTEKAYGWYIIRPDGTNDTLPQTNDGVNSYCEKMQGDNTAIYESWNEAPCPSLTKAYIRNLTEPTRVVFFLRFKNANNTWYNLADTVMVGLDMTKDINIHATGHPSSERVYSVCAGEMANMTLEYPSIQQDTNARWRVSRVIDGVETELSNNLLNIGNMTVGDSLKTWPVRLNTASIGDLRQNKIDSVYIQISADFVNGCDSNSILLVQVYPNFDTTISPTICKGESYYWTANDKYYGEKTNPAIDTVLLRSRPNCDSLVRLNLTVLDVSYTVDHVLDCKPITWLNGQTYSESNAATATSDTIRLQNQFGCDSIVQLDFELHPLTAVIHTNIDHFTYDNLTVDLTDISRGDNARTWIFPDGGRQSEVHAYYTIPVELDSADISLVAFSPYGCTDTTHVVIPFNKETFWMPNVFTPENSAGNNLFGASSTSTLTEEMFIYNRRGELVYQCNEVNCAWDGRDLKGNLCPQGAYVYIIRYTNRFEPDRVRLLKGTVTLIR